MKIFVICFLLCCAGCKKQQNHKNDGHENEPVDRSFYLDKAVQDCENQLNISAPKLTDLSKHPRLIETNETEWKEINNGRLVWTSGFYPGILWYMYGLSNNQKWEEEAIKRSESLEDLKTVTEHHDIGFMMFPSFGNGYIIGKKADYKDILLQSAASLASRYNPKVGTIKSWSNKMHPRWKEHITIIDNMMNLELLFWASKNGGDPKYKEMAIKHAETTMTNHFREDGTSWHVLEYDSITGEVLNKHTKQGLNDNSRWSRGQAWGIYGYTMTYRETRDKKFLEFAQKVTDKYLSMLPEDYVPYWDFDIDSSVDQDRDASAAAITASALIELSTLVENEHVRKKYYDAALKMLTSLSSPAYSGVGKADAFLLHSTGAKSLGSEIDVALIYADYYYIEALYRLKNINKNQ